ncbi:MAG: phosphoserine aminotransferase [Thermosediminibacterales bacterium]|nr:phosphoserine aminotransferase [Thermosediminibacterales bacterium]MDK2835951.1 phosphoserine aminotransferase [Thermosediminibacterales bacterium]
MTERVYNFYAGPATLPLPVLEQAQEEFLNYKGTGMSILEISHRSKDFEEVIFETEALMKELLGIGDEFEVLFLQGGASTQFFMVPMNFLTEENTADYILTGSWSEKALKEAEMMGKVHVAGSTKEDNYKYIPSMDQITLSENPVYVHITSNNTIFGTQWQQFPDFGDVPIVADMSSDMLSRPFDVSKFGLIYAGAQKNLGPSGVTVVLIRQDFLKKANDSLPTMLKYSTHVKKKSLYNTPPSFNIYIVNLVLKWIKSNGGLTAIERINKEKAGYIYEVIDNSGGFYRGHARKDSRSLMNVTFTMANADLEKTFVTEAAAKGLIGLKGHRSVGGLRASIYNAMPVEGCKALAEFMKEFQRKNG